MATKKTKVLGVRTPRGENMKTGRGWRLLSPTGRAFKVTLISRLDIGAESVAVLRVLPMPQDNS
jgi:hypothetical protein